MREVGSLKVRPSPQEEQIKESEQIIKKIGHIKESITPFNSNTKISDAHQKWYKYLPAENMRSLHSHHSREEHQDNYRLSLERRLQTLFREERDILKERHYANSISRTAQNREMRSQTVYDNNAATISNLNQNHFEQMQRKIRQLEQKYREQDRKNKISKYDKLPQNKIITEEQYKESIQNDRSSFLKDREGAHSSYVKTSREEGINHSVDDLAEREKKLEAEVDILKQSVRQIKKSNEEVMQRLNRREEKRKNKHRTKQLLLNILHRLEFMNVEIMHAKKRQLKHEAPHISKIESQAQQLLKEFQVLKLQYRHLDEERLKVQQKQSIIETKLKNMVEKK